MPKQKRGTSMQVAQQTAAKPGFSSAKRAGSLANLVLSGFEP